MKETIKDLAIIVGFVLAVAFCFALLIFLLSGIIIVLGVVFTPVIIFGIIVTLIVLFFDLIKKVLDKCKNMLYIMFVKLKGK